MAEQERGGSAFRRRQPGRSGWAVAAIVCSCAVFCLPLTLLGTLLGVVAIAHVRALPGRRGLGLAVAAVIIGGLTTSLWAAGAVWWDRAVREPVRRGPVEAIAAGLSGDASRFQAAFYDRSPIPPDEAESFLEEMRRRYGPRVSLAPGEGRAPTAPLMQRGRVGCPYTLVHADGTARMEAVFVIYEPDDSRLVLRFESLTIIDPPNPPLRFPAEAGP
ncbi:MAG: hypothetical protein ACYTGC_07050 [Planctomycetota bacterium]|jgi:hypothetical protein